MRSVVSNNNLIILCEPPSDHFLGGVNEIVGAISPMTQKPLDRLATLFCKDARLGLPKIGISSISLLYSWKCSICFDWFFYQIVSESEIRIISCATEHFDPISEGRYAGYPDSFPKIHFDLLPIDERTTALITLLNSDQPVANAGYSPKEVYSFAGPFHNIGGVPRHFQEIQAPCCPICGVEMPYFASISANNGSEWPFNDFGGQVLYFLCPGCLVLGAISDND